MGFHNTKDRQQPETDWTGRGHARACSTSKKKVSPVTQAQMNSDWTGLWEFKTACWHICFQMKGGSNSPLIEQWL